MSNMLAIVKDLRGHRLVWVKDYDGATFTTEDGLKLNKYECFLADPSNIQAVCRKVELKTPEDLYLPWFTMENIDKALELLYQEGFCIDSEYRIRKRMQEPFFALSTAQIEPIVSMHERICQDMNKNPETEPITLLWSESQAVIGMLIKNIPHVVPKVQDDDYKGRLGIYDNRQIVFNFGDWYIVPKNSNVGMMHKYLKVDFLDIESLSQIGKDKFITDDGIILKRGDNGIRFSNISIEGFLQ